MLNTVHDVHVDMPLRWRLRSTLLFACCSHVSAHAQKSLSEERWLPLTAVTVYQCIHFSLFFILSKHFLLRFYTWSFTCLCKPSIKTRGTTSPVWVFPIFIWADFKPSDRCYNSPHILILKIKTIIVLEYINFIVQSHKKRPRRSCHVCP